MDTNIYCTVGTESLNTSIAYIAATQHVLLKLYYGSTEKNSVHEEELAGCFLNILPQLNTKMLWQKWSIECA